MRKAAGLVANWRLWEKSAEVSKNRQSNQKIMTIRLLQASTEYDDPCLGSRMFIKFLRRLKGMLPYQTTRNFAPPCFCVTYRVP
jgi:hypothetical protein